jgi:hypothetical protein
MRYRYLHSFQNLFIDNLNGDAFATGKTTPEGLPDPSIFSTPQNREGIQLGTAIATLVRNSNAAQPAGALHLRDLWGTGKLKQLERESRHENQPEYNPFIPVDALGDIFALRTHTKAYITWPRLPDLFPFSFPGIKTSRDSLVVDIERDRLAARMEQYFGTDATDADIAESVPGAMQSSARFNPTTTRRTLQERGFRPWQILRYAYRPFDVRWLYWEPNTKLLDEKRSEYVNQMIGATLWIEARQRESGDVFSRGAVTQSLADNLGNGLSNFFPAFVLESAGTLLSDVDCRPNLSPLAESYLASISAPTSDLFYQALATMHTPRYRAENAGALLSDWPRIPLPATAVLLANSATLGHRLVELLDAESSVRLTAEWSFLAALKLPKSSDPENALKLTVGWGYRGQGSTVMPGHGLSHERPWSDAEREKIASLASTQSVTLDNALLLFGETCIDVHINAETFWSAIPKSVWEYTLGGHQVLKKWLSYRELPLLGRPIHPDEAAYFSQVVRRIAAVLLLGPALDASYAAILPTATGLPSQ